VGLAVSGAGFNVAASDPGYAPLYELCLETRAPVLIMVGTTGLGAGRPGGAGVKLAFSHPRHVDDVAATFPELTIVASRPAWPWQTEMIAILLHKANVWYEVHGWSPRYFTADLKSEIARRLHDRVMFGADYPMFRYERLIADWQSEGYGEAVLESIFYRHAERLFGALGRNHAQALVHHVRVADQLEDVVGAPVVGQRLDARDAFGRRPVLAHVDDLVSAEGPGQLQALVDAVDHDDLRRAELASDGAG